MQSGVNRLQRGPALLFLADCRVNSEANGGCFRPGKARLTMIVSEMLEILINSLLSR